MAKRSSKADSVLIVLLIVVGIPLFLIGKVVELIGVTGAIILLIAILGFVVWYQQDKKKKRLEYLRAKYDDESVVQKILGGYVWLGQSEEQLKDSMGSPVTIDRKVLKTRTKEVWKYHQQGANRFGLRVTVEDGYVIGWGSSSSSFQYQYQTKKETRQESAPKEESPYTVLNVSQNASWEEISAAYRKMAQMYHPDKVTGLAPEYREIAERRMRAINAAYEQLEHNFRR